MTASVPSSARCWAAPSSCFKVCCVFFVVRDPERLTIDAACYEKVAWESLLHAARGFPHARFFTRGLGQLALSLLQPKPDEWRRQHAPPPQPQILILPRHCMKNKITGLKATLRMTEDRHCYRTGARRHPECPFYAIMDNHCKFEVISRDCFS